MGGGTWKWVGDGVRQKLETVRVGSDWGKITNRADRKKKRSGGENYIAVWLKLQSGEKR